MYSRNTYTTTIFLTGGKIPGAARGAEAPTSFRESELTSFLAVDFPERLNGFESSYKLSQTVRQLSFSELLFFLHLLNRLTGVTDKS